MDAAVAHLLTRALYATAAIAFVYGILCYSVFFLTFLYLAGFLGNLLVP